MPYKDSVGQPAGYETMDDYGPLEPEDMYEREILNEPVENPVADADMFSGDPMYEPEYQEAPGQFQPQGPEQGSPGRSDMAEYQAMIHKMLLQRMATRKESSKKFAEKNMAMNDAGEG